MLGQILESLSLGTGIKSVGGGIKRFIVDFFIKKFVSLNFSLLHDWKETLFVKQLFLPKLFRILVLCKFDINFEILF